MFSSEIVVIFVVDILFIIISSSTASLKLVQYSIQSVHGEKLKICISRTFIAYFMVLMPLDGSGVRTRDWPFSSLGELCYRYAFLPFQAFPENSEIVQIGSRVRFRISDSPRSPTPWDSRDSCPGPKDLGQTKI